MLADQVAVTADDLRRLHAAWRRHPVLIAAALYGGAPGLPAIFPRWAFTDLLDLRGDRDARLVLRRNIDRVVRVPMTNAGHRPRHAGGPAADRAARLRQLGRLSAYYVKMAGAPTERRVLVSCGAEQGYAARGLDCLHRITSGDERMVAQRFRPPCSPDLRCSRRGRGPRRHRRGPVPRRRLRPAVECGQGRHRGEVPGRQVGHRTTRA